MMKQLLLLVSLSTLIVSKTTAQNDITSKDARKHIGEKQTVTGILYKLEIRKIKNKPDSALVLKYLGDEGHPAEDFISIIKVSMKGNTTEANWAREIEAGKYKLIKREKVIGYDNAAEGEIILFEGKPAIITNWDDMIIVEPVG